MARVENSDNLRTSKTTILWATIVATQLSVTGGIFALMSGASVYGGVILVAPLTVAVGIWLFCVLYRRLRVPDSIVSYHSLDLGNNNKLSFSFYLSASLAFLSVFLLGWELYIGSLALGQIIGSEKQHLIAILISMFVLSYTFFSSYDWAVWTDKIQLYFIALLLFTLLVINWEVLSFNNLINNFSKDNVGLSRIAPLVLTLLIVNVASQLHSIQNWLTMQSLEDNSIRDIKIKSIPILLISWSAVIIMALSLPSEFSANWLNIFSNTENILTQILLGLGVLALITSTIDTSVLGITNSFHKAYNIFHKKKNYGIMRKKYLRLSNIALIAVALLLSFGLLENNPEIFYGLLSLSSVTSVYIGYLAFIIFGNKEHITTNTKMPTVLFFIFLALIFLQFVNIVNIDNKELSGLILTFFGLIAGIIIPSKDFWVK